MLPLIAKHKLSHSVLSIGASENNIIILDSNYNLYELRDEEFIFAKKVFDYEPHHQFSKACAISMNGYIAIGEKKSPNCKILHIKNKNLIHIKTLSWHRADIYNIRFSKDNKYLVTGGEDGKVFIFSLPEFNIVNILPPRPDYISNIHFGKISRLVVYSSYDMVNCIFNMDTNELIGEFETNSVAEDMTFFDDDTKIFFICSNGDSGIYDIESKTINLKHNYNSWLTRVGMTKDNNFAYIGARDNTISYLNLEFNKPTFNIELNYIDGISCMRVINKKLYIGYSSGYLEVFDLVKFEDELFNAINNNDFRKASEISQKNISLKTLKSYIELKNKMWNFEFKKAQEILASNISKNIFIEVIDRLKIFFEDEDKKKEFDNFSDNIDIVKEFNIALETKNYTLAYRIVEQNSYLKQTLGYEKLENIYSNAFESAKILLANNDINDNLEAENLLKPFINVPSKKESINILLRNSSKFFQADKMIKNKQFGEFFKLAESFKAIKSTLNYKKAVIFGEQILATINELEAKNENSKAIELLDVLIKFTPFSKIALERKNNLLLRIEFLDLYNAKEYVKIYQQIHKFQVIKSSLEYISLSNYFNNIFENALEFASRGESSIVYRNLERYFKIKFFEHKFESIFNISYLNEIDLMLKNKGNNVNWRLTLESYIGIFGKNDEIIKICSPYSKILNIINGIDASIKKEVEFLDSIVIML
ncbi:hypothetical protein [Helicobacter sp. MIT 14-3879]|uniref:hypothetical protein n=1 Tax=Helicobacter sp. MIT 14-3879 TaxID=2040649 RepID=UPI000E1E3912|nr:hypothetical protein [Helicobacter sp. MIT 14-3879]RDU62620.1 hypothetical protein CQA44_06445 [Helicobacter sp. MIT 14-3879]